MLRFDAKRNAIRQCLAELETMGVVQRPHNKSAMVRDFDAKEIENIYLVRELLEAKAAELIEFPVSSQAIRELRNVHERHRSAAERGDLASVFVENLAFHRMLFDLCGNPDLVEAIELFQKKSHAVRSFSIANARLLSQVTSEHEAMLKALDDQDRGTLMRLVVEHLSPAKNAYLESYVRR
jgi:DNA-binding GntR family transcriptional regulator